MNTIFVSAGIARRDDGAIITADAVQCETVEAAIDHAGAALPITRLHRRVGIQRDRQTHVCIRDR